MPWFLRLDIPTKCVCIRTQNTKKKIFFVICCLFDRNSSRQFNPAVNLTNAKCCRFTQHLMIYICTLKCRSQQFIKSEFLHMFTYATHRLCCVSEIWWLNRFFFYDEKNSFCTHKHFQFRWMNSVDRIKCQNTLILNVANVNTWTFRCSLFGICSAGNKINEKIGAKIRFIAVPNVVYICTMPHIRAAARWSFVRNRLCHRFNWHFPYVCCCPLSLAMKLKLKLLRLFCSGSLQMYRISY